MCLCKCFTQFIEVALKSWLCWLRHEKDHYNLSTQNFILHCYHFEDRDKIDNIILDWLVWSFETEIFDSLLTRLSINLDRFLAQKPRPQLLACRKKSLTLRNYWEASTWADRIWRLPQPSPQIPWTEFSPGCTTRASTSPASTKNIIYYIYFTKHN